VKNQFLSLQLIPEKEFDSFQSIPVLLTRYSPKLQAFNGKKRGKQPLFFSINVQAITSILLASFILILALVPRPRSRPFSIRLKEA
jgi:hypothetical protein